MRPLTVDLERQEARPYFLWNEDLSLGEVKDRLAGRDLQERLRLLAILLREARDTDVWEFVSPKEVAAALPQLEGRLGRREAFWRFLIEGWRRDGLLEE